ncbi:hypothetical protein LUZ60_015442 [Juncus effusus]|nr:hypothetical protein LUZ60_015442 [Juncus effusus]
MSENSVIINVLLKGQESTNKLKKLLQINMLQHDVAFLLETISESFNEALACLNIPSTHSTVAQTSDEHAVVNTGMKRGLRPTPKIGHRRRVHPDSCTKVLGKSIDDGFTWRKYGQKEIFSSKFPRSYFRCTHKYEQNCLATRQVQQSEEHPDMYDITYIGQHICKQANKNSNKESSCILDFSSNSNQQVSPFSSPMSSIKHEHEDECINDQNLNSISSSEQLAVSHNAVGQFTEVLMGLSNDCDSQSFTSSCDAGEELVGDSLDFETMFFFDHQYEPPY